MSRIYTHPTHPTVDIPQVDLPTLLFESEHCLAQDDTVLHADAANPENKLTKSKLRELTERIAHGLRHNYDVGAKGPNKDVVTVMSYGQILIPAIYMGVIVAGGVYSAASPSSTVSELARQIEIGTSRLIICSVEHTDVVLEAARRCKVPLDRILVLESSPSWSLTSINGKINALSSKRLSWQRITDPKALKDSLITILWSSGTTGLPKGVKLSHLNLVAEVFLVNYINRQWAMNEIATKGLENFKVTEYRTLAHLPLSHIAGVAGYLLFPFYSAGTVYWMRKYNWTDLLKYARQYKVTAFYTVPSIYLRISKSPEVGDAFAHVEAASTGAAPMDAKLQTAANSRLGDGKNTYIGQTWGLSETTGAITAPLKTEDPDVTGCIGSILPCVELRLVDENNQDVEPGQEGEFLVRSPLVTNGYFNNDKATRDSFLEGAWFCTGDIGVKRNGKFYVVDRKKELLKYKGLQVAPAELENLLFTHPSIHEAAVVGIPAPNDPGTDWPRAYIVTSDSKNPDLITAEEVQEYVKQRVAQHKQLRGGVVFVDEIPKNAVGKFLRRELRERAKKEVQQEEGRRAKL